MFEEVTRNERGKRATRRGAFVIASLAVQTAFVIAFVLTSTVLPRKAAREKLVDVTFVKGAPRSPMPPPAPPRKTPPRVRPKAPRPLQAMVQPKEVPEEIQPPGPEEPPEPEPLSDAVGGGVIGGAVDGDSEASVPPPHREFDAATMARPVFVSGPDPSYTRQAVDHEVEGLMIVKCVITAEGRVQGCRVLKSLPFMDEAVVSALERRRYQPAMLHGQPLDVDYVFRLNLRLPR